MDRLSVSVGLGGEEGIAPEFVPSLDVAGGGVLLALPALLAVGLLRHADRCFTLPRGYYSLFSIFLLLGFMALARLKSMKKLRYEAGVLAVCVGLAFEGNYRVYFRNRLIKAALNSLRIKAREIISHHRCRKTKHYRSLFRIRN